MEVNKSKLRKIIKLINNNEAELRTVGDILFEIQELFIEATREDCEMFGSVRYKKYESEEDAVFDSALDFTFKDPSLNSLFQTIHSATAGLAYGTPWPKEMCIEQLESTPFTVDPLFERVIPEIEEYLKKDKFDYYSKEFRHLRLKVFLRDGEVCAKCGKEPHAGTSLTIDHIRPVSKYPELGLDIDNLQVLCWECNRVKSNKCNTDYRTK